MEQLISVRSLFKETDAYAGKQIKVGGWVRNLRASKNFGFINLSDGTFFSQVQVVYGSELANFNEISRLNIGAAVIVTGTLVLTPDAKQPFELQASEVFVEGPSTPDYPIQPKRHSMDLRHIGHGARHRQRGLFQTVAGGVADLHIPQGIHQQQHGADDAADHQGHGGAQL